jgi:endonuclease III
MNAAILREWYSMSFAQNVIGWQRQYGRRNLPWQGTRDPYRIWLSEVMLQQTQVSAVIPYYERFLARYPTVKALAAASQDEVLQLWSGLGYYARGRNLHKAAVEISRNGFPRTAETIAELPGVGRSTAAAIAVFAYGERAAILDGNVKRVLSRCYGVHDRDLWPLAERLMPRRDPETYTQGLMARRCASAFPIAPPVRSRRAVLRVKPGASPNSRRRAPRSRCRCGKRRGLCSSTREKFCWSGGHRRGSGAGCGAFPSGGPPGAASSASCRSSSTASRISACASCRYSAAVPQKNRGCGSISATQPARRSRRLSEIYYTTCGEW